MNFIETIERRTGSFFLDLFHPGFRENYKRRQEALDAMAEAQAVKGLWSAENYERFLKMRGGDVSTEKLLERMDRGIGETFFQSLSDNTKSITKSAGEGIGAATKAFWDGIPVWLRALIVGVFILYLLSVFKK